MACSHTPLSVWFWSPIWCPAKHLACRPCSFGDNLACRATRRRPQVAEEYLPIIHLVFANLKTWLNGIHHGVSHQHLHETFGKDKRGDEMPDWAGDKAKRLAKIEEAMAALEADAKLAAEEERRIEAEKEKQRDAEGRKKPGKPAAPPSDEPDPKAQRNFTDPESRIMKSKDRFVQAYNAQAAVDADAQIIVAHELTQCGSDQGQLVPLVAAIENNLGRKPEQASADSGYCSEANLEALVARGIDGYVAPGRAKHPTAANGKVGGPLTQLMRKKIDDGGFETPYRLRKQVVGCSDRSNRPAASASSCCGASRKCVPSGP